jgi:hypothetical protein
MYVFAVQWAYSVCAAVIATVELAVTFDPPDAAVNQPPNE